jgi:hypothetical protein
VRVFNSIKLIIIPTRRFGSTEISEILEGTHLEHHMQMRRAEDVPAQRLDHVAYGPVARDGVRDRAVLRTNERTKLLAVLLDGRQKRGDIKPPTRQPGRKTTRRPSCAAGLGSPALRVQSTLIDFGFKENFLQKKTEQTYLRIVQPVPVRLPRVDDTVRDRVPLGVENLALDPEVVAFAFRGDALPVLDC